MDTLVLQRPEMVGLLVIGHGDMRGRLLVGGRSEWGRQADVIAHRRTCMSVLIAHNHLRGCPLPALQQSSLIASLSCVYVLTHLQGRCLGKCKGDVSVPARCGCDRTAMQKWLLDQ